MTEAFELPKSSDGSRTFQEEVRTSLAAMSTRREEPTRTGNQTGLIKNCKVGDIEKQCARLDEITRVGATILGG